MRREICLEELRSYRKKRGAYCVSFENFAYLNLGYEHYRELGPGRDRLHHTGGGGAACGASGIIR